MNFRDQIIWITGASSGIGEALAYAFSREGAKLILSGRRAGELERVRQACDDASDHLVLPLDLAQYETLADKAREALAHFGRIDILVNNGGVSQRSLVKETSLAVDVEIMNINFFGTVALTKAVLPGMLERKSGHVVIISSVVGHVGTPLRSAYAASKHALHGFFDSLRAEVWQENIKVTIVCPGFIRTNVSINARSGDGQKHGRMDAAQDAGMSPEACAAKILSAVASGREEVLIGGKEINGVYLKRFLPTVFSKVIRKARVT
ncbi:MAG TPA: SDR family oxidoreductase [Blastocatellia bacterium]|nr:SDR family oxidoreductase [Blastocatellia bacterium]